MNTAWQSARCMHHSCMPVVSMRYVFNPLSILPTLGSIVPVCVCCQLLADQSSVCACCCRSIQAYCVADLIEKTCTGHCRVFQDRCPHRLAPLSEGRIDNTTGHLYCNYHGWQFDGSGSCTDIPQMPQGQTISSSRSCVASYPTCEREGLL